MQLVHFVYRRLDGSTLYYSIEGTGAWTFASVMVQYHQVHQLVMQFAYGIIWVIVGDGVGSIRHTTNGTAFTNTTFSTISNAFAITKIEYTQFNLIYLFNSNDATNWALSILAHLTLVH